MNVALALIIIGLAILLVTVFLGTDTQSKQNLRNGLIWTGFLIIISGVSLIFYNLFTKKKQEAIETTAFPLPINYYLK